MKHKIFLLFLLTGGLGICQWTEQNSGTTTDLYEVCFTDSLNGFALGKSILLHTSDGGKNWNKQNFSTSTNTVYTAYTGINAFNKDIAIFVGDTSLVYYTTNGGEDWLTSNTGYPYHYLFSSYLNDSTVFITGTKYYEMYGGGIILKSTNYGSTWEKIFQTEFGVDPIPYWIDDLFFTSTDTGYAIFHISFDNFGPNYFMKTTNGGYSWFQISETPGMVLDLENKDNIIWAKAAGFNFSTDFGLTWQIDNIAYWAILDMHIIKDNYGLFLIYEYYEDAMNNRPKLRFADITDSLFYDISLPDSFVAYSFSYVNERNIWLCGKDGKIFKYNTTPVNVIEINSVETFSLSQNFPNPFNPTTKIKYTIPTSPQPSPYKGEGARVRLKVYDILGNEVATLVNKEQPAGNYEVELDGSKLSSGIYFYVLNFGNQRLSKKMCLIK